MDLSGLMDSIVSLAQSHTVIAIILGLGLLFFMVRKPKLFFSILFLCLFLAGLYYMITTMAGSGAQQKKRMIPEEGKQLDKGP